MLPTRMLAHVVIEVDGDAFDSLSTQDVLHVNVREVEIKQGLLNVKRRVLLAEGVGGANREAFGLDEAPALRLYVQPLPEEE